MQPQSCTAKAVSAGIRVGALGRTPRLLPYGNKHGLGVLTPKPSCIQNCKESLSVRGPTRRNVNAGCVTRPWLCMTEAATFKAHPTGFQIRPCRLLELHAQADGSLQPTQGKSPLDANKSEDDGLAGLLSLLRSHRLVRHDPSDHAGSGHAHLA